MEATTPQYILHTKEINIENQQSRERFKEKDANWQKYQNAVNLNKIVDIDDVDDMIAKMIQQLYNAATQSIPFVKSSNRKKQIPWRNETVKQTIYERKLTLKIFKRNPTKANLINYKKHRAKARLIINTSKNLSWKEFVSKIHPQLTSSQICERIKQVNGNTNPDIYDPLQLMVIS